MHAWQRRRIDLTKLLKNACGIFFQMRINAGPISANAYVIPFIQAQANNVTFQQDNARPHVARVVRDYLTQQNVDMLPCPAVSHDFLPTTTNGVLPCAVMPPHTITLPPPID
jgi:hypothetical protein